MPFKKIHFLALGAVLLALFLILPIFLPSELEVSREVEIKVTQEDAYSYLVNLEAWKEWSPWLEKEPSASFEFSGIPGVVGSYSQWKGEEIGSGRQTLVELKEPYFIKTLLEFQEPMEDAAFGFIRLEDHGESVVVQWGMQMSLGYPMGRLFGLFIEDSLAPDFEKGLQNLKLQLEPSP